MLSSWRILHWNIDLDAYHFAECLSIILPIAAFAKQFVTGRKADPHGKNGLTDAAQDCV